MFSKKIKIIALVLLLVVAGFIIYDSTSQPTPTDLKGGFKEVALYRNPNNTGPIIRIYAATVADRSQADLQAYGNMMPYTKYGETTVYFFDEQQDFPSTLQADDPHFDARYNDNCIAVYKKDANGQVSVTDAPF
ncbi:hypothetical protein CLV98_102514 [Dyadobacter jejuensis]|uniref:Uncharacterized protein n=1 Tax=Dyadobacter jejuensis TaxID=1082580 RepID=A0A316AQV4_9BACT|nr:hypothetical protein [Dyadobacter jejuensis]PWJ59679.1 hypothetical protein CLV98_102514 [Dyadobacter jejuensis]